MGSSVRMYSLFSLFCLASLYFDARVSVVVCRLDFDVVCDLMFFLFWLVAIEKQSRFSLGLFLITTNIHGQWLSSIVSASYLYIICGAAHICLALVDWCLCPGRSSSIMQHQQLYHPTFLFLEPTHSR